MKTLLNSYVVNILSTDTEGIVLKKTDFGSKYKL